MNGPRLSVASLTHTGLVRAANEDSFLSDEAGRVWGGADGMGGHAHGRWASAAVVHAAGQVRPSGDMASDAAAYAEAIRAANAHIFAASQRGGARMGSTVALLHMAGDRFAALWAGDSRIYLMRRGSLRRLTRDHSQVQEMVDRGLLSAGEAIGHPMSHVLSRAVGVEAELEVEQAAGEVAAKDVFLICSDGLSGVLSDEEIAARLTTSAPAGACRKLLDLVLARGAPDNVTLIAVVCEEITVLSPEPAPKA